MNNQYSGAICVPYYDSIRGETLDQMSRLDKPASWITKMKEGSKIDDQRNWLVEHTDGDFVFFLDSDVVAPDLVIPRLVSLGMPIVSGLVFNRRDSTPLVYKHTGRSPITGAPIYQSEIGRIADALRFEKVNLQHIGEVGLLPHSHTLTTDAVGAGCLLIRRDVFKKVPYPWFSFRDGDGEDTFFCRHAAAAGFSIYVDVSVLCGHYQRVPIGWQHFLLNQGVIR